MIKISYANLMIIKIWLNHINFKVIKDQCIFRSCQRKCLLNLARDDKQYLLVRLLLRNINGKFLGFKCYFIWFYLFLVTLVTVSVSRSQTNSYKHQKFLMWAPPLHWWQSPKRIITTVPKLFQKTIQNQTWPTTMTVCQVPDVAHISFHPCRKSSRLTKHLTQVTEPATQVSTFVMTGKIRNRPLSRRNERIAEMEMTHCQPRYQHCTQNLLSS